MADDAHTPADAHMPADVANGMPPGGAAGGPVPPDRAHPVPATPWRCIYGCGTVLHELHVKVARLSCGHLCACWACARIALVTNRFCPVCFKFSVDADYVRVSPYKGILLASVELAVRDAWFPGRFLARAAAHGCTACWKPFGPQGERWTCDVPGCKVTVHPAPACAGGLPMVTDLGKWVCGLHRLGGALPVTDVLGPVDAVRRRLAAIEMEICETCGKEVKSGTVGQCRAPDCGWRGCMSHMAGKCECGRLACPRCTAKWKSKTCIACFVEASAGRAGTGADYVHDDAYDEEDVPDPEDAGVYATDAATDTNNEEEWDADVESSDDDEDDNDDACPCGAPVPVNPQLCRASCTMVCASCAESCCRRLPSSALCGKLACDAHMVAMCRGCGARNVCMPCYGGAHKGGACTRHDKPSSGTGAVVPAQLCTLNATHGRATTRCKRAACGIAICQVCVYRLNGRGWCTKCGVFVDTDGQTDAHTDVDAHTDAHTDAPREDTDDL